MANTTVYPYGTNGELPSSIGLVNDLVTGGADKALTAEQGKALNEKIDSLEEPNVFNYLLFNNKGNLTWDHDNLVTANGSSGRYYFADYRKVKNGDEFRVVMSRDSSEQYRFSVVLFAVPPTSSGISGEELLSVYVDVNTTVDETIYVKRDGYISIMFRVLEGYSMSLDLYKFLGIEDRLNLSRLHNRKINNITLTSNKVINCTTGAEMSLTSNYSCSGYIDIGSAKYVKLRCYHITTNSIHSSFQSASFGAVFYDADKQMIGSEYNQPIEMMRTSSQYYINTTDDIINDRSILQVPSGCKYIRFTENKTSFDGTIEVYQEDEGVDDNIKRQLSHVKTGAYDSTPLAPLRLVHFSDIHGSTKAAEDLKKWLADNTNIYDDILCTGDVVNKVYNSNNALQPGQANSNIQEAATALYGHKWWSDVTGLAEMCLFTLGNHDGGVVGDTSFDTKEPTIAWDGIGKDVAYSTYFEPFAAELGITLPTGYSDSSSPNYHACYWHKDYANQKIRVIGIDCIHRYDGTIDAQGNPVSGSWKKHGTMEQENWLSGILNEVLDTNSSVYGWSVLFACHYPLDDFDGLNETWDDTSHKFVYNSNVTGGCVMNDKTQKPTIFHNQTATSLVSDKRFNMNNRVPNNSSTYGYDKGTENIIGDIIQDFIDNNGKCIGWLCGHHHVDYMFYSSNYPDILNIPIVNTGDLGGSVIGEYDRNGDTSFTANLITIDTEHSLIKLLRIGLNVNYKLENRHIMCYDYANKAVLSEW